MALELAASGTPGRRGTRASGRAGSGRSGRSRTACCAPSRRRPARRRRPPARSAATVKRIITSGPHDMRHASGRVETRRAGPAAVTTPTCPSHSGPALSTVTSDLEPRACPRVELVGVEQLVGRCARRRAAPAARSARAAPAARRIAGAAAPGRCRRRRPRHRRPRPARPARARRTARARRAPARARRRRSPSVASPTARTVCTSALRPVGIAADRDRHLAGAARRQHRELARGERERLARAPARARASTCRRCPGAWTTTTNGAGTIGPGADGQRRAPASSMAVDVEQLEPRRLQPLDQVRGEPRISW